MVVFQIYYKTNSSIKLIIIKYAVCCENLNGYLCLNEVLLGVGFIDSFKGQRLHLPIISQHFNQIAFSLHAPDVSKVLDLTKVQMIQVV